MTLWFISDTHFGHDRIIQYCNRPFLNNDEMDNVLIQKWNNKIKPNDFVYHLGDFSIWVKNYDIDGLLQKLNGRKTLIVGNHDTTKITKSTKWEEVCVYKELNYMNQKIILFHYPIEEWDGFHNGSWHLHGHTHNRVPSNGKRMDVGVDACNFEPISFEELKEKFQ